MITCVRCLRAKPADAFYRDARRASGRYAACKECHREIVRGSRRPREQKVSDGVIAERFCRGCQQVSVERGNTVCQQCRENTTRRLRLRRLYGISVGQYDELAAAQANRCAVCGRDDEHLVVDHDHETGAVRGLLCGGCNSGLGLLQDSPEVLSRARDYLLRE